MMLTKFYDYLVIINLSQEYKRKGLTNRFFFVRIGQIKVM